MVSLVDKDFVQYKNYNEFIKELELTYKKLTNPTYLSMEELIGWTDIDGGRLRLINYCFYVICHTKIFNWLP